MHVNAAGQQDQALDDRIVAGEDRIDRQPPEAGNVEHALGDDDAGNQQREAGADDGEDRDRGVAQRMAEQHDRFGQPLGAGGADIILAEHVQHLARVMRAISAI